MRRDGLGVSRIGKIIAHWREPEFRSAVQQTCNRLIEFAIDTSARKMTCVALCDGRDAFWINLSIHFSAPGLRPRAAFEPPRRRSSGALPQALYEQRHTRHRLGPYRLRRKTDTRPTGGLAQNPRSERCTGPQPRIVPGILRTMAVNGWRARRCRLLLRPMTSSSVRRGSHRRLVNDLRYFVHS
jgi:hypothetical protein